MLGYLALNSDIKSLTLTILQFTLVPTLTRVSAKPHKFRAKSFTRLFPLQTPAASLRDICTSDQLVTNVCIPPTHSCLVICYNNSQNSESTVLKVTSVL